MMPNFMGDHIRLCEFTRSAESGPELIEKAKIEIDLLVFRTVERADRILRHAACRRVCIPEENQFCVPVGNVLGFGENASPVPLDIIEDKRDKLDFGLFLRIQLPVRGTADFLSGSPSRKQRKEISV